MQEKKEKSSMISEGCKGQGGSCGKPIKGSRTIEVNRTFNFETKKYESTTIDKNFCGIHLRMVDNRVKARNRRVANQAFEEKVKVWATAKDRVVKFLTSEFGAGITEGVSFNDVVGFAPGKYGTISDDADFTDGKTLADLIKEISL